MKIRNILIKLLTTLIIINTINIPVFADGGRQVSPDVKAGSEYTVALKSDGRVWAWGDNEWGQLGDGTREQRNRPVEINAIGDIIAISAGHQHTVALEKDGTVWEWGNTFNPISDTPVQVDGLRDVTAISAGDKYTVALKSDGTIWGWGMNSWGQLGDGTRENRLTPVQVSGLNGVIAISAGNEHTMALKSDGTVWAWGMNRNGVLGDGSTLGTDTPTVTPVQINGLSGVTAISAGYHYSLALKSDGSLWAWGANGQGQLGDGTKINKTTPVGINISNISKIEAGNRTTMVIKNDGSLWAWGLSYTETPAQVDGLTDVKSVGLTKHNLKPHKVVLKNDESIWTWGANTKGQLGDGSTSSTAYITTPVRSNNLPIGANKTVMTDEDSTYTFTTNDFGYGDIDNDNLDTVKITNLESKGHLQVDGIDVIIDQSISARDIEDGKLKYMPETNSTGPDSFQFKVSDGIEDSVDTYIMTINVISSGGTPTDISIDNNIVKENQSIGTLVGMLSAIDPDVGDTAAFTLVSGQGDTDNQSFTIEGRNLKTAQVFDYETKSSYSIRVRVTDSTNNTYDEVFIITVKNLPEGDLQASPDVKAGSEYTVALKSDGRVWAWGDNEWGQLGDGTREQRNRPVEINAIGDIIAISTGHQHTVALEKTGTVWEWGNTFNPISDTPVQVDGLRDVTAISAGDKYTVALKSDGTIWGWGMNRNGVLGDTPTLGTDTPTVTPIQINGLDGITAISAGYHYSLALKSDGSLWAWGANGHGQLGDGTKINKTTPVGINISNISKIEAGNRTTMVIKNDGSLWVWGLSYTETPAQVDGLTDVKSVGLTKHNLTPHKVVIKNDDSIWTWGANTKGQLGDGSTSAAYITTPVRPNNLPTGANKTVMTDEDTPYTFTTNDFGYGDIDNDALDTVKITNLESKGNLHVDGIDVSIDQSISRTDIEGSSRRSLATPIPLRTVLALFTHTALYFTIYST